MNKKRNLITLALAIIPFYISPMAANANQLPPSLSNVKMKASEQNNVLAPYYPWGNGQKVTTERNTVFVTNIIRNNANDWRKGIWSGWMTDPSSWLYLFAPDKQSMWFEYHITPPSAGRPYKENFFFNYNFYKDYPRVWYQIVSNRQGIIQEGWTTVSQTDVIYTEQLGNYPIFQMKFDVEFINGTNMQPYLYYMVKDAKGRNGRLYISNKPNDLRTAGDFRVVKGLKTYAYPK